MNWLSPQVSHTIYHLIDLLWIPIGWFAAHPHQRWKVLAFIIACLATFRMEVELANTAPGEDSFLHLLTWPVYARGLVVYSVIIMLYLVLAHYSPKTHPMIFFAASLTIYVFAFGISMALMLL